MSQDEPERIPIPPQSFLTYVEELAKANDQPINGAVHLILMIAIAQAAAVVEVDSEAEGSLAYFLDRVEGWLEYAMEQVPSIPSQNRIRLEYQGLRRSAEEWLRHLRARAGDTTDIDSA